MNPGTFAKAIIAFVVAGSGALNTALLDGTISVTEWIFVGAVAVVAGATVYTTPNATKEVPDGPRPGAVPPS